MSEAETTILADNNNTITESKSVASVGNDKAFLVLGMHRSGTSMLTRLLNILGISLGNGKLLSAKDDNKKGFWENKNVKEIHDSIFHSLGSSWDDPSFFYDKFADIDISKEISDLEKVLEEEFLGNKEWLLKEPRLSRFIPLWQGLLAKYNIDKNYIIVMRNPYDSARSLEAREYFPDNKSLLLWLVYNLDIEKYTRNEDRKFIKYEDLMEKPLDSLCSLNNEFPSKVEKVREDIKSFITPSIRNFSDNNYDRDINPVVKDWIAKAYKELEYVYTSSNPDYNVIDYLYEEIKNTLNQDNEITNFWYQEAIHLKKSLAKESNQHFKATKELHQIRSLKGQHEATIAILKKENSENKEVLETYHTHLVKANHTIKSMVGSTSWRITRPLRAFKKIANIASSPSVHKTILNIIKNNGIGKTVKKSIQMVRKHGIRGIITALHDSTNQNIGYDTWIEKFDTLTNEDRDAIKRHIDDFELNPLISVVMPVYDIEERYLRQVIESVRNQLYTNWEFCIADDASPSLHIKKVLKEYEAKDSRIKVVYREKNGHISESSNSALELVTGEFIALLDHDDLLPEHALYHVVNEINKHPDVDLIYSDEDKINQGGKRYGPYFKSGWNPDLFFSQNMFSHLGVYRTSIIQEIGGFRKGYEGSQDYDLCLRAIAKTSFDKIRHIPKILYHWRAIEGSTALTIDSKSYALAASRRAITDYFNQNYKNVEVVDAEGSAKTFGYHRVVWPIPENTPKVSIIIPTKDKVELLRVCIESIITKTSYSNYEIIIIDNNSEEEETRLYLEYISDNDNVKILTYDKPFNYSDINNFAVKHAKGSILAFLNNDTEVIDSFWLEEMVGYCLRPDIGAVGAKLIYDNYKTQHGGIILGGGADKVAAHAFYNIHKDYPAHYSNSILSRNVGAVTAACMVVEKSKFDKIGGFDADNLPVSYNDVDLCIRLLEQGYLNVITPHIELFHHESLTRGDDHSSSESSKRFYKEKEYMLNKWGDILNNDPFYNPNLDRLASNHYIDNEAEPEYAWQDYK